MTTKQRLILNFMSWLAVVAICSLVGCADSAEPVEEREVTMPEQLEFEPTNIEEWEVWAPALAERISDGFDNKASYKFTWGLMLVQVRENACQVRSGLAFDCDGELVYCPKTAVISAEGFSSKFGYPTPQPTLRTEGKLLFCSYPFEGQVRWMNKNVVD